MARYIIKRILMIIPIILGVTLIVFLLLYLLPGSSIALMKIDGGGDALDKIYGLFNASSNFITKYIRYCYNIFFHFDFSRTISFRRNVMDELTYRARNTMLLLVSGIGLTLAVGIPVGAYAAVHKDTKRDRIINLIALFLSTIPNYAIALLLTLILVLYLGVLPLFNSYMSPRAFILPALTISLGGISSIMRMTRTSMIEILEKPYITALRSKGVKESAVIYKHALKNALVPVISVLGGLISQLLFGTIIVEFFFSVPALGSLMLNSVSVRDHFTILGCTVVLTIILVATNIAADIFYALIDPQIRLRYKKGVVLRRFAPTVKARKPGKREPRSGKPGNREAGSRVMGNREAGNREAGNREAGTRDRLDKDITNAANDAPAPKPRNAVNLWAEDLRRLRKNKAAVAGFIVFAVICIACLFAPILTKWDYSTANTVQVMERPSSAHILGTDYIGRDLFARLLYGGRVTLKITFVSTILAAAIGGLIGLTAGFMGSRVDFVLSQAIDLLGAIPVFLLIIAIEVALGWGQGYFMYAMAIAAIPQFARLARASVMKVMGREYIEAARALGVSNTKIITRHIIHNIAAPFITRFTSGIAEALLTCTIMGYLKIGISPPTPEWGAIVFSGKANMRMHPRLIIIPCIVIIACVISVSVFGDGLRDALDPRE